MTEVLYKKVGRKYIPIRQTFGSYDLPTMKVGSFVLTYAYADGGESYTYDVTPDTASFVAASKVAQKAMEEAIQEKCKYKPEHVKWTKKQKDIMADYHQPRTSAVENQP